jgi:hypothetical protein
MKTKIELFGYQENNFMNYPGERGWGNGYVLIPKGHPYLIHQLLTDLDPYGYLSIPDFHQEITFNEWTKDNEYWKIGFDTNHRYNNSTHDKQWVTKQCEELKAIIDNYTFEEGNILIDHYIQNKADMYNRLREKYNNTQNK